MGTKKPQNYINYKVFKVFKICLTFHNGIKTTVEKTPNFYLIDSSILHLLNIF